MKYLRVTSCCAICFGANACSDSGASSGDGLRAAEPNTTILLEDGTRYEALGVDVDVDVSLPPESSPGMSKIALGGFEDVNVSSTPTFELYIPTDADIIASGSLTAPIDVDSPEPGVAHVRLNGANGAGDVVADAGSVAVSLRDGVAEGTITCEDRSLSGRFSGPIVLKCTVSAEQMAANGLEAVDPGGGFVIDGKLETRECRSLADSLGVVVVSDD